jgi:hypothetical protein
MRPGFHHLSFLIRITLQAFKKSRIDVFQTSRLVSTQYSCHETSLQFAKKICHKGTKTQRKPQYFSWCLCVLVAGFGCGRGACIGKWRIASRGGREIGLALIAEDFISPEPIGGGGIAPKGISEQEGL